jgi:hypothetical protein
MFCVDGFVLFLYNETDLHFNFFQITMTTFLKFFRKEIKKIFQSNIINKVILWFVRIKNSENLDLVC